MSFKIKVVNNLRNEKRRLFVHNSHEADTNPDYSETIIPYPKRGKEPQAVEFELPYRSGWDCSAPYLLISVSPSDRPLRNPCPVELPLKAALSVLNYDMKGVPLAVPVGSKRMAMRMRDDAPTWQLKVESPTWKTSSASEEEPDDVTVGGNGGG